MDDIIDSSISDTKNWVKGSYDTVKDSLVDHYYRHGAEVGATDLENYLNKAQGFAKNLKNAKKSYNPNGFTEGAIRYEKNGKYIILDPDKNILSFGAARK